MKVRAAGICGSDVMEWYRVKKVPRILGHEVAGEVVAVGAGVKEIRAGDRIAASHHVPCYECHFCRLGHHTLCDTLKTTNFDPGGFAEWIRIPEINCRSGIYKLPEQVSFEQATFIEPLACVYRGQQKANVRPGQTVLVIGCGVSGLLHILLARARHVEKIIACDIVDYRLEAARQLGADVVFRSDSDLAKKLKEVNDGRLADQVIACSGHEQATRLSLESAERGGTVLFFALHSPDQTFPLAMNDIFWQKGLTLMSTYAASPEDHRESLKLIAARKIDVSPLITHRLGLSEVGQGFNLVANPGPSMKVILDPTR